MEFAAPNNAQVVSAGAIASRNLTTMTRTFIGFDGWTGSMQPSYIVLANDQNFPERTILDGFLYPVKNAKEFISALFDAPEKIAFWMHDFEVAEKDIFDFEEPRQNQDTYYVPHFKGCTQRADMLKAKGYTIFEPKDCVG